MIVRDVVDRLNAECPLLAGRARPMRDLSEIENIDGALPVALVLRSSDVVQGTDGAGALITQTVARSFAVVLMAEQDTATEPMEALREQVRAAMLTWHPDAQTQFEYAGGEAQPPVAGIDRWQDTYRYTDYQRYQI